MTLSEFKAWFEGFTEDMDAAPNAKQWKRIKARVKEIDGTVTTYPVYLDRYVYPWSPTVVWNGYPRAGDRIVAQNVAHIDASAVEFEPSAALYSLGKSEARSFTA